jgi:hypothetical protein
LRENRVKIVRSKYRGEYLGLIEDNNRRKKETTNTPLIFRLMKKIHQRAGLETSMVETKSTNKICWNMMWGWNHLRLVIIAGKIILNTMYKDRKWRFKVGLY